MDVKEKQKFELAFNYIGGAMATAFEKASPERKKQIGLFITCIKSKDLQVCYRIWQSRNTTTPRW
jgi:hypothetical protein